MLRVAKVSHVEVFSGEEIKGMVTTSHKHGEIHAGQATMRHYLFEFDQRRVGRIVIPIAAIQKLDVGAGAGANLSILQNTDHSRFPLIDSNKDDMLLGVVLAKDIHRAWLNGDAEPWNNLGKLCRDVMIVPETQYIARLFDAMRVRRARMACVVDEYGSFIGVITLEDLLEEIVGEFEDETDDQQPSYGVKMLGDSNWEVEGLASLTDIERIIGFKVSNDLEVNTITGLFMRRLSGMPELGDVIREGDFDMKVIANNGHRIGKVGVVRVAETSETEAQAAPKDDAKTEPEPAQ
ncbi:MAG: CBS domain containing-hemolysin-like protein [Gammaproteobacteria bacterium]|jgi:CBS domain containing-hemolysin-like protein